LLVSEVQITARFQGRIEGARTIMENKQAAYYPPRSLLDHGTCHRLGA